jgi:lactose/L-arabinose transport system substrate-binding protein
MKQSLAVLKDLNDKGLLYLTEGWNNWISAFNNGETVGFLNALWIIGTLKSKPDNAGKWMVIPTPLLEGVPGAQNASNNGGSSWYVFASSKNKSTAVDFLKSAWASSAPDALQFYNTILKGAGAMGTYLPSRNGSN